MVSKVTPVRKAYRSAFQVDLVAKDDKGEVLGVPGAGLYEELVSPTVQCLERVGVCHVKHEDTAVGTAIERHAQTLEPLLARRVPDLENAGTQNSQHIWNMFDARQNHKKRHATTVVKNGGTRILLVLLTIVGHVPVFVTNTGLKQVLHDSAGMHTSSQNSSAHTTACHSSVGKVHVRLNVSTSE